MARRLPRFTFESEHSCPNCAFGRMILDSARWAEHRRFGRKRAGSLFRPTVCQHCRACRRSSGRAPQFGQHPVPTADLDRYSATDPFQIKHFPPSKSRLAAQLGQQWNLRKRWPGFSQRPPDLEHYRCPRCRYRSRRAIRLDPHCEAIRHRRIQPRDVVRLFAPGRTW